MVIPMFRIDQEIIDKASEFCVKRGECLFGILSDGCKITGLKGNFLIVEPIEQSQNVLCTNCIKVENAYICLCKLRKEIYRKYNQ
jgi:hypothetical protein